MFTLTASCTRFWTCCFEADRSKVHSSAGFCSEASTWWPLVQTLWPASKNCPWCSIGARKSQEPMAKCWCSQWRVIAGKYRICTLTCQHYNIISKRNISGISGVVAPKGMLMQVNNRKISENNKLITCKTLALISREHLKKLTIFCLLKEKMWNMHVSA